MSYQGMRYISSSSSGRVGIGLSTIVGPTGPPGAFGGPQGLAGEQGGVGLQGSQGIIGLQGLAGSTGVNGLQGLQGLIGSTGTAGSNGLQGSQGGAGMGFVVFANTTSYTGLNTVIATGGNIGQFVLVLGGDLFVYAGTGSGYTGPNNSYGYAGDVTDESKLIGMQGAIGYQGTQGLQGLIGATGPSNQGVQGLQGYQGLIGATGPSNPGVQGLQGYQGLVGETGSIGYQGYQGLIGLTGSIGVQGNAGQDSSARFQYRYSTSTTYSDPGSGYFRLNNSTMSSATGLYIDVIDYDPNAYPLGNDITNFLSSLTQYGSDTLRGVIKIEKASDNTWYQSYNFSTVTNNSGWFTITLNNIIADANFTNNDICYISFVLAGPRGETGSIGYQGLIGFTGPQGLVGSTGSIGLQGLQGYQGPTGVGGALGYYGSFFDTTIQAITIANTGYVMTYNNTLESNGIFVSNESRINFQNGGVYNLQFSAQFDKTDSGTDTIDVWLRQNGVNVPWTNTRLTSVGNNDKMVAAWNFMQTVTANDYLELVWMSNDIGFRIYSETGTIAPVRPGIPSLILTVQQVMNTQIGPQGLIGPQGGGVGGVSSQFLFNQSGAATGSNKALIYLETSTGANIISGCDIIPSTSSAWNLGSLSNPWKSIYISTGTVFIGPTGAIGIDNNGVVSSLAGFASPFVTVGSTNPGAGITLYNNQNKLYFINQSGASGPVSNWSISPTNVNNIYFTGGNVGIGTNTPNYPLTVNGTIYCQGLTGVNLPIGLQGPTGLSGTQGISGQNGSSSSLTLYLDTAGGTYSTSQTGTLMTIPNQGTQTTITSGNQSNTTINIANFISNGVPSNIIQGGNWDLNLFGFANSSSSVSFYFDIYYTDSDGISNQTLLAAGTGSSSVFLSISQSLYTNSLYVPATILPDTTHRILIKVYLIFSGNNKSATLEFRDGTISHLHTTILTPDISAGQSSQIIFNQSGAYTGSSNLIFTNNNLLTTSNLKVTSSNNATGSSTGALIVTGGINVNGESVFNNLVYAPSLNPNFINRGNPGQSSSLLLSNYNTVHYYSTTSATGFIDISTTMVENAVYEIEFNCYGASASNNDMFLYPNYSGSYGSTTFYQLYTQSSGTPGIQYTSSNSSAFYFDYVSGSIGWEPVGKIKIFNNRGAKKVKIEAGDTTSIVNGQGYWTSGSGFTNNSVTNIVYDTATQWNNIGRILFSSNGSVTFTNWNIWVKRIM